jgi:hypothetical protein
MTAAVDAGRGRESPGAAIFEARVLSDVREASQSPERSMFVQSEIRERPRLAVYDERRNLAGGLS